jgi:ferredoxin
MGKLVNIKTNKQIEVKDNAPLVPIAEEVGVIFACQDGMCASCRMEIVEGMENLTEKTQNEKDQMLYDNERLACQCKIKKGTVKMKTDI